MSGALGCVREQDQRPAGTAQSLFDGPYEEIRGEYITVTFLGNAQLTCWYPQSSLTYISH
jgi:hypothetical protein